MCMQHKVKSMVICNTEDYKVDLTLEITAKITGTVHND